MFKKGDRVKIITTNLGDPSYKGKIGVIEDIDLKYEYPYCVNTDDGKVWSTVESISLQPEDLIPGEWYYMEYYSDQQWIAKYSSGKIFSPFVLIGNSSQSTVGIIKDNGSFNIKDADLIRKATKEEVEKYFPDEFKSKDVTPEYVECIKGGNSCSYNKVGVIYKVKKYDSKKEVLTLEGGNTIYQIKFDGNSTHLATDYKISTKEAFDLQNTSKVEEKPEALVFGKFKIGSIVVSLTDVPTGARKKGTIVEISTNSNTAKLAYKGLKGSTQSYDSDEWRLATPEECRAFEQGITNIKDMKTEENLTGRYLKALVKNPVGIGMNIGEYLLITGFNTYSDNTYDVTRVKDNQAGFGIETHDLPKFELMPVGFNPKAEQSTEFKVGDWVVVLPEDVCYYNAEQDKAQQIVKLDDPWISLRFSNGTTNAYQKVRFATPSEIYEAQKLERDNLMSKVAEDIDTIFEQCKEIYTVGTTYKDAASGYIHTVESQDFTKLEDKVWGEIGKGCLYYEGKFAEIVYEKYDPHTFEKKYSLTSEPSKVKPVFNEQEFLSKDYNKVLELPVIKKYKKRSIINL